MLLVDKLSSAWYEIIAPEKDALLNDSKILDKKIKKNSPIQKSIDKLIKLQKWNSWEERYILNEQLNELKNINKLYQESKKDNITQNTKKEITSLIVWIEKQINLKDNILNDDYESLDKIIKSEKDRFEDTIDIISPNTIRDNVEKYIDISWIKESLPQKKYQDFFDIASVTYINILEKIYKRKLPNIEEKALIQNDWLYLDENEAIIFLNNLDEKIKSKGLYINFDFEIKLHKFWWIRIMKSKDYYEIKNEEKKQKKLVKQIKEKKEKIAEIKLHREIQIEEYIVNEAADLIIKYEWFISKSKWDTTQYSRGYWTKAPWKDKYINKIDAKKELLKDVQKIKKYLEKYFPHINTNQKISLISFFYNNWTSKKWKENLIWRLKNLNKEVEWIWKIKPESVANIILKYNKSWWKVLEWLKRRRLHEAGIFLKKDS